MLTGAIIGMAQALGETAPLLMIGVVAFIVDIPQSFTDPATVLRFKFFSGQTVPSVHLLKRHLQPLWCYCLFNGNEYISRVA